MSKATEEKPIRRYCAACHSSGEVWVRGHDAARGRKIRWSEPWLGTDGLPKIAVECRCATGEPYRSDPALPGHPQCACKGRGWTSARDATQIPDGAQVLGETLSGASMVKCPCVGQKLDRPGEVQRETIPTHQDDLELRGDMDVLSGMWAVD